MLRVVLLVLYLIALSLTSVQSDGGGAWDPLGLNPPPAETDGGGHWDPLG